MSIEQISPNPIDNAVIIEQLAPTAEEALHSHLDRKEKRLWLPHEIVPFYTLDEKPELDDPTMSALYINGLTEDNLPHYTATIKRLFGRHEAWGEWNNRWTWEESLHTRGIERYIDHIGVFDADWLESTRKAQITSGEVPEPDKVTEVAIYVTIQEELTRIAHSKLAKSLPDSIGTELFGKIAGDEGRHHIFYRSISVAMRNMFPDEFIKGLAKVIRPFAMPGTGIPGFEAHAQLIDAAGLFTKQDVAKTIINLFGKDKWNIDTIDQNLVDDEAKQALAQVIKLQKIYNRFAERVVGQDSEKHKPAPVRWQEGKPILLRAA